MIGNVERKEWQAALRLLNETKDTLRRIEEQMKRISPFAVTDSVVERAAQAGCDTYSVERHHLFGSRGRGNERIAQAKSLTAHLLHNCLAMSDPDIAAAMGWAHSTTSWHARKRLSDRCSVDEKHRAEVDAAVRRFRRSLGEQPDLFVATPNVTINIEQEAA